MYIFVHLLYAAKYMPRKSMVTDCVYSNNKFLGRFIWIWWKVASKKVHNSSCRFTDVFFPICLSTSYPYESPKKSISLFIYLHLPTTYFATTYFINSSWKVIKSMLITISVKRLHRRNSSFSLYVRVTMVMITTATWEFN